jgi:hypothetical protein
VINFDEMVTVGLQNGHKAGVSIAMLEVTYSRKFGISRSIILVWENFTNWFCSLTLEGHLTYKFSFWYGKQELIKDGSLFLLLVCNVATTQSMACPPHSWYLEKASMHIGVCWVGFLTFKLTLKELLNIE